MTKKEKINYNYANSQKEEELLHEVMAFYQQWDEDNDIRRTRKNGWDDITRAYYGELPEDWPYISRVTDPRIRTSIIEKDARLLNKKPRGKVIPRNSSKSINAAIQNAILSLQWDNATDGGTMQEKLIISSQDTRMYQSKFALVYWKETINENGQVTFSGNEMKPLDIRDCGLDPNATHIRDAKRFQYREWVYLNDLENDNKSEGKTLWKNLRAIKGFMKDKGFQPYYVGKSERRDNERSSVVLGIKGLEDHVGTDSAYDMIMLVHELREDRLISFCPRYGKIVRDIPNPYKHGKIPVAQLRYYPIQDEPLGESEVESVIPLWKAIQATVCGYLDEMILKMRPPLKIVEGSARIETIEYGPEAQWLVDNPDAVTEMRSTGEAQRWFQTTYAALVSAFNNAMGDLSQNVSNVDSFNSEKTATEIKQVARQQNARDQRNQNELADFIQDIMRMWIANNKQFYFSDPKKKIEIVKLVGEEQYEEFIRMGLADEVVPESSMETISQMVSEYGDKMSDIELSNMFEQSKMPAMPVMMNPEAQDLESMDIRPKLNIDQKTGSAELYVSPQDFDGDYDFVIDIKSMEAGADYEYAQARTNALSMIKDQSVQNMLMQEGWRPKIKDLLVSVLNEGGYNDSHKFFERIQQGSTGNTAGILPPVQNGGVSEIPAPLSEKGLEQPMVKPRVI